MVADGEGGGDAVAEEGGEFGEGCGDGMGWRGGGHGVSQESDFSCGGL